MIDFMNAIEWMEEGMKVKREACSKSMFIK